LAASACGHIPDGLIQVHECRFFAVVVIRSDGS